VVAAAERVALAVRVAANKRCSQVNFARTALGPSFLVS
jgi:hypothetical protein